MYGTTNTNLDRYADRTMDMPNVINNPNNHQDHDTGENNPVPHKQVMNDKAQPERRGRDRDPANNQHRLLMFFAFTVRFINQPNDGVKATGISKDQGQSPSLTL
jgi:hypothetical protein